MNLLPLLLQTTQLHCKQESILSRPQSVQKVIEDHLFNYSSSSIYICHVILLLHQQEELQLSALSSSSLLRQVFWRLRLVCIRGRLLCITVCLWPPSPSSARFRMRTDHNSKHQFAVTPQQTQRGGKHVLTNLQSETCNVPENVYRDTF